MKSIKRLFLYEMEKEVYISIIIVKLLTIYYF